MRPVPTAAVLQAWLPAGPARQPLPASGCRCGEWWKDGSKAGNGPRGTSPAHHRSEEHTSELQSLMRISYAVFCLKKKQNKITNHDISNPIQHNNSYTNT